MNSITPYFAVGKDPDYLETMNQTNTSHSSQEGSNELGKINMICVTNQLQLNFPSTMNPSEMNGANSQNQESEQQATNISSRIPKKSFLEYKFKKKLEDQKNQIRSAQNRKNKKDKIEKLYRENFDLKDYIEKSVVLDSEIKNLYKRLDSLELEKVEAQSRKITTVSYNKANSPEEKEAIVRARKERNSQSAARSRERENNLLNTLKEINQLLRKQRQTIPINFEI